MIKVINNNGSQLKNPDTSGAILTLSLSILILNSQSVEGAKYVRVLSLTPSNMSEKNKDDIFGALFTLDLNVKRVPDVSSIYYQALTISSNSESELDED